MTAKEDNIFLKYICAAFFTIAIGWAGWVSHALINVDKKIDLIAEKITINRAVSNTKTGEN